MTIPGMNVWLVESLKSAEVEAVGQQSEKETAEEDEPELAKWKQTGLDFAQGLGHLVQPEKCSDQPEFSTEEKKKSREEKRRGSSIMEGIQVSSLSLEICISCY